MAIPWTLLQTQSVSRAITVAGENMISKATLKGMQQTVHAQHNLKTSISIKSCVVSSSRSYASAINSNDRIYASHALKKKNILYKQKANCVH